LRNGRDIVTSVVFLGLSAAIYSVVKDYPTGTVQEGMGARLFPLLLTISLAILSLVLLMQASLQRNPPEEEEVSGKDALLGRRLIVPAVLIVLLALYLVSLEEAGFLIATPIFLLITMRVLGSGFKEAAVVGVAFTVVVYLIFDLLLKVPLPEIPFLAS